MANKWYLRQTTEALKGEAFKKLDQFADILREEIKEGAPGSLKDGIKVRKNRIRGEITVASTHKSGLPVPAYVEFGTPPHVITPKTASVLRWVDDDGTHFAKRVHHPGTDPNPYMRRGISRAVFRFREVR
jgi:hypothetical protein